MTEDQIKHMVDRFLGWKLPEHFRPDAGISFEPEFNKEWNAKQGKPPQRYEPVGTNLFSADQATAMVRYMVEGMLGAESDDPDFFCEACGCAIKVGDKYTPTLDGCYLCEKDAPSYQDAVDHWNSNSPETDDEREAAEGCRKELADHVSAGGSPDDIPLRVYR